MSQKTKLLIPRPFFMKAVIVCDDFAFTESAASTLARVGRQMGVNVHWISKCWPMNALNDVALTKDVLADSTDAHLIVFPAPWANSLPSFVFDWLGHWTAVRTIQHAALGIIKVGNDAPLTDLAFSELSRFAREYSLNLIVDDDPPARNPARLS